MEGPNPDIPERLARHGLMWRMGGWPIFDPYGELVEAVVLPEQWEWDDLTSEERAAIDAEVADYLDHRPQDRPDLARSLVLGHYGIACPHRWVAHEPTHRECAMCRLWEPLPGRLVWVGDREMRVTDPPPPVLRVPRPSKATWVAEPSLTALEPEIDEYRWNGRQYEIASR